jgi:hypothetical protein
MDKMNQMLVYLAAAKALFSMMDICMDLLHIFSLYGHLYRPMYGATYLFIAEIYFYRTITLVASPKERKVLKLI